MTEPLEVTFAFNYEESHHLWFVLTQRIKDLKRHIERLETEYNKDCDEDEIAMIIAYNKKRIEEYTELSNRFQTAKINLRY